MTRILKLTLCYDGTAYVGWQRQLNGSSIQALIEEQLARIEGGPVDLVGAGRTDAGVHALGQVASVAMASTIEVEALRRALNATLPEDIRVLAVEEAPSDFHARFGARSKTYEYRIVNGAMASPFDRRYAWHVPAPLDVDAMRAAAAHLTGTHDFTAFQASGSAVATTTRTVARSRIEVADDPIVRGGRRITYEVTGNGFLRHMVRTIAGTLVDIGGGRWPAEAMREILASRDRARAGPTAPAQGLFLVNVQY